MKYLHDVMAYAIVMFLLCKSDVDKNDQKVHFKAKKAEKVHLLLHLDKPGLVLQKMMPCAFVTSTLTVIFPPPYAKDILSFTAL